MSPFDEPNKKQELTPEQLDKKPIYFGKHKLKTPEQIAEIDPQYVKWAYETVTHNSRLVFCSEALYRECGGKGKSRLEQEEKKKEQEARKPNSYRPASSFDDMDDNIPF